MKTIALLRANPKDAWIGKLTAVLSERYAVDCYIWDRQGDFVPHRSGKQASYRLCRVRAGFYDLGTVIRLLFFEAWLFCHLLVSRYDAIHAIDFDTGFVGLFVARLRRKKFVYHCLDPYYAVLPRTWPSWLGALVRMLENWVITQADVFLITDMLRLPQHEGARPKSVVEIANVPFIEMRVRKARRDDVFHVGYIGSLVEGRNLVTLIEAAGSLAGKGVELTIGGFGPLEDLIRNSAKGYPNIRYYDWMPFDKVIDLEATFDVFVHVTDRMDESQRWVSPNKLFESMAFAVPIVVGEGTVSAVHVQEIGNGLVVPYGSVESLRDALVALKNDRELCATMGAKGRQALEHRWDMKMIRTHLLEVYETIR